MSINTKSTINIQMGKFLSEALTKKAIAIPVNLAATAIVSYFNPGSIAKPDAYYITADRINAFTKGTILLAINTASHVTLKGYIKGWFDYALHPIFGHKQSDLGEASDFTKEKFLESFSPDIIKEDFTDIIGVESAAAA